LGLDVKAGRDVVQQGSDMSARYDINLQAGRNMLIDGAPEQSVAAMVEKFSIFLREG
jgi:filamentous hemagglutinin